MMPAHEYCTEDDCPCFLAGEEAAWRQIDDYLEDAEERIIQIRRDFIERYENRATEVRKLIYDRTALVEVFVYHWRTNTSGCGCGWAELGKSHAEHVATVYEDTLRGRGPRKRCPTWTICPEAEGGSLQCGDFKGHKGGHTPLISTTFLIAEERLRLDGEGRGCVCAQAIIDREALALMAEALSGGEVRARAHSDEHYRRIETAIKTTFGSLGTEQVTGPNEH